MLISAPNDYITWSFFIVGSKEKERSLWFLAYLLKILCAFKWMDVMFAREHGWMSATESALGGEICTRSFIKVVTDSLDLLPRISRVCLMPSTSLGSFLRRRRMARIDLGFSYMLQQWYTLKFISCKQNSIGTLFSLKVRRPQSCTWRPSDWACVPNH